MRKTSLGSVGTSGMRLHWVSETVVVPYSMTPSSYGAKLMALMPYWSASSLPQRRNGRALV